VHFDHASTKLDVAHRATVSVASDDNVRDTAAHATSHSQFRASPLLDVVRRQTVEMIRIPVDGGALEGDLALPEHAAGVVVFAHGSGSGRHSPRNKLVAAVLNDAGIGTLLVDLLTPDEEQLDLQTRALRFDIPLLARRLEAATAAVPEDVPLGYFGASTGAAAALFAAADLAETKAVVSRGGRPDLAAPVLGRVQAPTLLIVGERDPVVVDLNRRALQELQSEKELVIVPHATHLFEEPGSLERVAEVARDWFLRWFYSSS
jgi:dienelactone hydrolase